MGLQSTLEVWEVHQIGDTGGRFRCAQSCLFPSQPSNGVEGIAIWASVRDTDIGAAFLPLSNILHDPLFNYLLLSPGTAFLPPSASSKLLCAPAPWLGLNILPISIHFYRLLPAPGAAFLPPSYLLYDSLVYYLLHFPGAAFLSPPASAGLSCAPAPWLGAHRLRCCGPTPVRQVS
eukprot:1161549-Pelagomonas_calceolata.AAC.9